MRSQYFEKFLKRPAAKMAQRPGHEDGFYVWLFAAALLSLLAIGGLAFDSALAYRARTNLQNALDAGSLKGAYLLQNGVKAARVENLALSLAAENLKQDGFDVNPPQDLQISVNAAQRQVAMSGTARQASMLLGALPGFRDFTSVGASAVASFDQDRPVAAVLLFDLSSSMNLPTSCGSPPCPSKIDALKQAASLLVQDPDFILPGDGLALTGFSHAWHQIYDMTIDPDKADVLARINAISTGSGTNIQLGIRKALEQFGNNNALAGAFKVILFISDGRASRALVADPYPNCPEVLQNIPSNPNGSFPNTYCANDPTWADCVIRQRSETLWAIQESDMVRAAGVTIYTIGLGERPEDITYPSQHPNFSTTCVVAPAPDDPFQGAACLEPLGDFTLRRISGGGNRAGVDFPCVRPVHGIPSEQGGTYVWARSTDDLNPILKNLSRAINAHKVRLVL